MSKQAQLDGIADAGQKLGRTAWRCSSTTCRILNRPKPASPEHSALILRPVKKFRHKLQTCFIRRASPKHRGSSPEGMNGLSQTAVLNFTSIH
ncbi:hypothetical protein AVEN_34166-1 [Araneus ventricosus]|uniref:Uncharacterized protein n=1 Tax=Araneus ventricosus TaxID=182803 RepID=A0A4Y2P6I2_ARAVE|nr:hypothetical protein AVEN_34166-1 [Araneus ventricosus]